MTNISKYPIILWKKNHCQKTRKNTIAHAVCTTDRFLYILKIHQSETSKITPLNSKYSRVVRNVPDAWNQSLRIGRSICSIKRAINGANCNSRNGYKIGKAITPASTILYPNDFICFQLWRRSNTTQWIKPTKPTTTAAGLLTRKSALKSGIICHRAFFCHHRKTTMSKNIPIACFRYCHQKTWYWVNDVTASSNAKTHARLPKRCAHNQIHSIGNNAIKTHHRVKIESCRHQTINGIAVVHHSHKNGSYICCIRFGNAESCHNDSRFRYAKNIDLYNPGSYPNGIDDVQNGNDLVTPKKIKSARTTRCFCIDCMRKNLFIPMMYWYWPRLQLIFGNPLRNLCKTPKHSNLWYRKPWSKNFEQGLRRVPQYCGIVRIDSLVSTKTPSIILLFVSFSSVSLIPYWHIFILEISVGKSKC